MVPRETPAARLMNASEMKGCWRVYPWIRTRNLKLNLQDLTKKAKSPRHNAMHASRSRVVRNSPCSHKSVALGPVQERRTARPDERAYLA